MTTQTILEDLILVRMLAPGKVGLTVAKIKTDLATLVSQGSSSSTWGPDFDHAYSSLLEKRFIVEELRPGKRGKAVVLADYGRQLAVGYLGISELPSATTWSEIKNFWLIAKSLNLSGPAQAVKSRIKSAALLQAAVVAKEYCSGLSFLNSQPKQIWDALYWKCLGVETGKPFTLKAIQEHLLRNLTGVEGLSKLNDLKAVAAASALKARRKDLSELRRALLRQLTVVVPGSDQNIDKTGSVAFVESVRKAAQQCEIGPLGGGKVFISHVWRKMQELFPEHHCPLQQFKQKLVELNRKSLVELCRADLIEAMDGQDISESLLNDMGSEFHFIRLTGV